MGAAIQGAIVKGEIKEVLLLDVTPLSLGIETLGGVNTVLIERNTTIPTRKSQIFTTAAESQTSVTIVVLQGERPMASDNVTLGKFDLVDIPPAPRGIPKIEVTFDIDANGIVRVTAKDLGTQKEQSIHITAPKKLSKEEIQEMVKQAEKFASEDKKRREEVETLNQGDSVIYATERTLKEFGNKISQEERADIEAKITQVKTAIKEKKSAHVKRGMDRADRSIP